MFSKKIKFATDVDGILEEGRSWVKRLELASKETELEAASISKQIALLTAERDVTKAKAAEGKAVAESFKSLLHPVKT